MAKSKENQMIDNLATDWDEDKDEYEVDNAFAPQPIQAKTTFGYSIDLCFGHQLKQILITL